MLGSVISDWLRSSSCSAFFTLLSSKCPACPASWIRSRRLVIEMPAHDGKGRGECRLPCASSRTDGIRFHSAHSLASSAGFLMRIVLKFGSGILANPKGTTLDERQFRRLSSEVAELVGAGHECLIVSSGAVAAGLDVLGLNTRPEELAARQACAAIGQTKLMSLYAEVF